MGTTGTGRFTDYPKKRGNSGGDAAGSGSKGVTRQPTQCDLEFDAELEEVDRCTYFKRHAASPPSGANVVIRAAKRLEVVFENELVGYLPTEFNYLALCIEKGYGYSGEVTVSISAPLRRVRVHIVPGAP